MLVKVIIPARFGSTRFPGKPLASLLGKPMIEHVYRRAEASPCVDEVWVATDDQRIIEAVSRFGGRSLLTSTDHPTGTHRVIQAAQQVGGDLIVNLQGDEPLVHPEQIEQVVQVLIQEPEADIATLQLPTRDPEEIRNPHCVKVVTDHRGYALYFSRSPIPYYRRSNTDPLHRTEGDQSHWGEGFIHLGLYGFRRSTLQDLVGLPPAPWEDAEKLEQLRFLYWGYRIRVVSTAHRSIGVDVPEDLKRVEQMMKRGAFSAA
jgi:3-deoxy-manno-octulosonate cytidylyltransferase (CMP-KDO synthetase)